MKNKSRLYYGAGTSDSPKLFMVFFYLEKCRPKLKTERK